MRPAAILAALLAAPAALAWHDEPWTCRVEGIVEVTGGSWETTFYLDLHEEPFRDGVSLYQDGETEADLQRGGASPYVPDDAEGEACADDELLVPDVFLF